MCLYSIRHDCKCDGNANLTLFLFSFQYYEMSYGLNIEMHKQVGALSFLICLLGGFSSGTDLSAANRVETDGSCCRTCVIVLVCVLRFVKLRFVLADKIKGRLWQTRPLT